MQNEKHSSSENPDLKELLKSWEVPEVPNSLNRRVISDYRQHVNRVPFWKKIFMSSVRIPMPLMLAQAALLLVAGAFVISSFVKQPPAATPVVAENIQTKFIEVPVIQEKIVTKIVYATTRTKPQIKVVTLPPTHSEEMTVRDETAAQIPVAVPEASRLITPNVRAIRSIQIPELPVQKQNFAETAYISDSPFTILARNNFDLPATLFARPAEPSSMKFSKLASSTTGLMMKMIDNKSTRMVYRFGGRTKTFAQEAIIDRILFRPRIDPNWSAAFGDACAPH